MAEVILPGTYISVRDEGLITAGRIATGYVGIVGTAARGPVGAVVTLGSVTEARAAFGEAGPWRGGGSGEPTLMRALELAFNNGATTVLAVRVAGQGAKASQLVLKKGTANLMTVAAKSPGAWGDAVRVRVRAAAEGVSGRVVEVSHGEARESFQGADAAELAAAIAAGSSLVSAAVQGVATNLPDEAEAPLAGGADGEAAGSSDYGRGLESLENETVNLVLLAGQDASMAEILQAHLNRTAQVRRERIGFIGSNGSGSADDIAAHSLNSDRLVYVGPGIRVRIPDPETRRDREVDLPGAYTAAAVAGLVAALPVQASPTNKPLAVSGLAAVFNQPKLEKLVQSRVLAVEKREGFRIVKGITTSTNPAWHQITTRRIVDYAMAGVRSSCNPYIGKLNNVRVRSAMKATIDGFLTRMVQDEALVGYQLEVSATRAQEVAGEAIVTMTLQPTFSIDFIMVTMYLS